MDRITIREEQVKVLLDTPFVRVYDLQYAEGRHYYDASRRKMEDLCAIKTDEEFKALKPDGVNCIVIVREKGKEAKLLFTREYRFPTGRFILNPPAGMVDKEDYETKEPMLSAAKREIKEETGLTVKDTDRIFIAAPLLFSTPGLTDECNCIVCAVVDVEDLSELTNAGAEDTEVFDGFALIGMEEAKKLIRTGCDEHGIPVTATLWAMLMYFIGGLWMEELQ